MSMLSIHSKPASAEQASASVDCACKVTPFMDVTVGVGQDSVTHD
jgi:hypothetical protein